MRFKINVAETFSLVSTQQRFISIFFHRDSIPIAIYKRNKRVMQKLHLPRVESSSMLKVLVGYAVFVLFTLPNGTSRSWRLLNRGIKGSFLVFKFGSVCKLLRLKLFIYRIVVTVRIINENSWYLYGITIVVIFVVKNRFDFNIFNTNRDFFLLYIRD